MQNIQYVKRLHIPAQSVNFKKGSDMSYRDNLLFLDQKEVQTFKQLYQNYSAQDHESQRGELDD